MLDIKFIRENPELIKEAAKKKRLSFNLQQLLDTDKARRELLQDIEKLRAQQNKETDRIAIIQDDEERKAAISAVGNMKEELSRKEAGLKTIRKEWYEQMYDVPNIPDPTVPEGKTDEDNELLRKGLEPNSFDFTPKDHIALAKAFDLLDLERGAKVSGFRGYFLKNDAVLLSFALWQFTIDMMIKKGYEPVMAPTLVREENLIGTGHFPQAREDVYKLADDDLYLAGTAEIPLMGYRGNEILKEEELPKKFIAFSPCFRREAGSHGKDTRGIYRLHEFFKVEQLILCENNHELSVALHEELTKNAEEIAETLELPYRIVTVAAGQLGRAHVKTYDIEVWIPSEKRYRESHSSSYYHDFQTRRLNIRYRDKNGHIRFCHSLNNTAIATPRILISLLENHQQKDGSIRIPHALQKYIGKAVMEPKK
ncbi:MAG: serine--tRNA ligase [Candidatus Niyogibacteria bacterium]|nr:serine--tRNA ligase [Candidatus Niyogibacteria bacterium]